MINKRNHVIFDSFESLQSIANYIEENQNLSKKRSIIIFSIIFDLEERNYLEQNYNTRTHVNNISIR